jgi:hypothetical protein
VGINHFAVVALHQPIQHVQMSTANDQ